MFPQFRCDDIIGRTTNCRGTNHEKKFGFLKSYFKTYLASNVNQKMTHIYVIFHPPMKGGCLKVSLEFMGFTWLVQLWQLGPVEVVMDVEHSISKTTTVHKLWSLSRILDGVVVVRYVGGIQLLFSIGRLCLSGKMRTKNKHQIDTFLKEIGQ